MSRTTQTSADDPFVSIIVVNFNGREMLEPCLASVLGVSYPTSKYEVILVDNNSTDGSSDMVRERFPTVRILPLSKNYGFTGGNNRGAVSAKGDILVFLNNDTVVDRNWLDALVRVFRADESVGLCGSKVLLMDANHTVQYNGATLHQIGGAIPGRFCGERLASGAFLVGSVLGASFAIRKAVFTEVGGFDEDFFLYADEGDLCLRSWIMGHAVAYNSESFVYHRGGGSSSDRGFGAIANALDISRGQIQYGRLVSASTIYYGNRNSIALAIKNFETRNLFLGVLFSYLYLLYQLLVLLERKATVDHIHSLMQAAFWPIGNFASVWRKRQLIQRQRKVTDGWLLSKGLLLSAVDVIRLALRAASFDKPLNA